MSIGPLGRNFCEILLKFATFQYMEMRFKLPSAINGGHSVPVS